MLRNCSGISGKLFGSDAVMHIFLLLLCFFPPFDPSDVIRGHSDRYFAPWVRVSVG